MRRSSSALLGGRRFSQSGAGPLVRALQQQAPDRDRKREHRTKKDELARGKRNRERGLLAGFEHHGKRRKHDRDAHIVEPKRRPSELGGSLASERVERA